MPELAFSSGGVDTDAKNRQHEEKKEAEKKKHSPTTATTQQFSSVTSAILKQRTRKLLIRIQRKNMSL